MLPSPGLESNISINIHTNADMAGLETMVTGMQQAGNRITNHSIVLRAALIAALGIGISQLKQFTQDSLKEFENFQAGTARIFTLIPQASGQMRADLEADAQAMSVILGRLPEELLPAIYLAISQGVPQDNLFTTIEAASKAARGGVGELHATLKTGLNVWNSYSREMDIVDIFDTMFVAIQGSELVLSDFEGNLANITAVTGELGIEFGAVTTALAAMALKGADVEKSVDQLEMLFIELGNPAKDLAQQFEKIAGMSFRDFVKENEGPDVLLKALRLLKEDADATGQSLGDLFEGKFWREVLARQALLILSSDLDVLAQKLEENANAAGRMEASAKELEQTLKFTGEQTAASAANFKRAWGEALGPTYQNLLTGAALTLDLFTKNTEQQWNIIARQAIAGADGLDEFRAAAARLASGQDIETGGFKWWHLLAPGVAGAVNSLSKWQARQAADGIMQANHDLILSFVNTGIASGELHKQLLVLYGPNAIVQYNRDEDFLWINGQKVKGLQTLLNAVIDVTNASWDQTHAIQNNNTAVQEQHKWLDLNALQMKLVAAALDEYNNRQKEVTQSVLDHNDQFAKNIGTYLNAEEVVYNWREELIKATAAGGLNREALYLGMIAVDEWSEAHIRATISALIMEEAVNAITEEILAGDETIQGAIERLELLKKRLDDKFEMVLEHSSVDKTLEKIQTIRAQAMIEGYVRLHDRPPGEKPPRTKPPPRDPNEPLPEEYTPQAMGGEYIVNNPTRFLVGEGVGPEYVYIAPLHFDTGRRMRGGSGGVTINGPLLHIETYHPSYSQQPEQLADLILTELQRRA